VPAIKTRQASKSLVKKKPAAKPRTTARVEDTEDTSGSIVRSAAHKQVESPLIASARNLGNGEVLIACQLSELVPVAQYANVTLGPNMIAWKLNGADMNALADVDWDAEEQLTDEQQSAYDRIIGALKATSKVLEIHISDDRETVERSIRQHNEREASEASEKKKPRRR